MTLSTVNRATADEPGPILSRYVVELRDLAAGARTDALASTTRLVEEVALRLPVNVHRYELLARHQHVAAFVESVLAGWNSSPTGPTNPPLRVAEGVATGYLVQHSGGTLDASLRTAVDRVLGVIRTLQEEDDAEAAHEAETDRRIAEHERNLAERDA